MPSYVYNPVSVRTNARSILVMSKLKSHSGTKKRIYKTGSGKLVFKRNSRAHLLMQKTKKAKRRDRARIVHPTQVKTINRLVPNL